MLQAAASLHGSPIAASGVHTIVTESQYSPAAHEPGAHGALHVVGSAHTPVGQRVTGPSTHVPAASHARERRLPPEHVSAPHDAPAGTGDQ